MGESAENCRKKHVDSPLVKSKTCLIHGLGNTSDECKVLEYFDANYAKGKPNKYHGIILYQGKQ